MTKLVSKVKLLQEYFNQIAMKVHQSHLIFIQSVKLDCNLPVMSLFFKTSKYRRSPTYAWFWFLYTQVGDFWDSRALEQWLLSNTIFFKSKNSWNLGTLCILFSQTLQAQCCVSRIIVITITILCLYDFFKNSELFLKVVHTLYYAYYVE